MLSLPLNRKFAVRKTKDHTDQVGMNTNQTKLQNILQDYLGIKVTGDILVEMIGSINQDCGVAI
jgi:hypothetical protein